MRVFECSSFGDSTGKFINFRSPLHFLIFIVIIAGMDWVAANRVLPAVASMSFGGGASTAFVDAINNMNGGMQKDMLLSCGSKSGFSWCCLCRGCW